MDLPVSNGWSLLEQWRDQAAELAADGGTDGLTIRLILDGSAPDPYCPRSSSDVSIVAERDPRPFRGTGGILRDVTEEYEDDDYVLVANAAQVVLEPLAELAGAMAATGGDICVVSHTDGTPSGVMLVRCACLRVLPKLGFVDMKEQGLPMIAERFKGSVVYRRLPWGLPVRNLEDYIRALGFYHRWRQGVPIAGDPFAEDWMSTFSIIEEGAVVEPDARIHDSVILRGGRVESDAFVVRSIVCPTGVVSRNHTVVNELITKQA